MIKFNSVTGQYEDDGQDVLAPSSFNIPAGRMSSPDGSLDIKIPTGGIVGQMKFERDAGKDLQADMLSNPEAYPFAKMFSSQEQTLPKEMSPIVKEYIAKKVAEKKAVNVLSKPALPSVDEMERSPAVVESPAQMSSKLPSFMDKFSEDEYQKAKDTSREDNAAMAIAQVLGGFGDVISGRDPSNSAKNFAQYRQQIKDATVGDFEKQKKSAIDDYNTNRSLEQNKITDDQRARDMDINSDESKMAQALAIKMGVNPAVASKLTAAKFKETSPVMEKMYAIEQARLARQDAAAARSESKEQRQFEKDQLLETTYGQARTHDDAKQLKAAAETKTKFDRQLQELIQLRKDKGVEYLDRDSVARAKQLSRDLLLGYKDLAKLGVLSQSDENILNDIIPNDPLGQDWAPGQDPTLHKLEKFQGDVNSDFNARLDQRLRNPSNQQRQKQQQGTFPKQVKKGNQVATVNNAQELKEAQDEGFE